MQSEHGSDLYALILRYATLPVLLLVLTLCFVITNYLMSTKWQQARRNKQIKKAIAAREALLAQHAAEKAEETVEASQPFQRK